MATCENGVQYTKETLETFLILPLSRLSTPWPADCRLQLANCKDCAVGQTPAICSGFYKVSTVTAATFNVRFDDNA